jgi:hypothetical protein
VIQASHATGLGLVGDRARLAKELCPSGFDHSDRSWVVAGSTDRTVGGERTGLSSRAVALRLSVRVGDSRVGDTRLWP